MVVQRAPQHTFKNSLLFRRIFSFQRNPLRLPNGMLPLRDAFATLIAQANPVILSFYSHNALIVRKTPKDANTLLLSMPFYSARLRVLSWRLQSLYEATEESKLIRWRTCPGEALSPRVDPQGKNITIKEMKTNIKHRSSPEMEG